MTEKSLNNASIDTTDRESDKEELEDAGDGTTANEQVLHGFPLILCALALLLCMFCHALDQTIVATVITLIGNKFGDFGKISWVTTGYLLPGAVLCMTYGSIALTFGRKATMVVSVLIFEAGSLVCALCQDMDMLIGGRVLAGVGGGGISVLTVMIATEIVSTDKRGMIQGLIGACFGIASVLGPFLGGALSKVSFRWVFYINLPIGGVAVVMILFLFKPPPTKGSIWQKLAKIDYLGTVLLTGSLVLLLLAVSLGSIQEPWNSPLVISFFVVGGCLFLIYLVYNFNLVVDWCKHPMIPWEVVKVPTVLAAILGYLFEFGGFMMSVIYLAVYFQVVRNASPMSSGIQLLPFIIPLVIASIVCGIAVSKTRYTKPFTCAGAALASIGTGLLVLLDENSGASYRIGLLFLPGIGVGFTMQVSVLSAQTAAPKTNGGVLIATALAGFGRATGGTIGSTLGQTIQTVTFKAKLAQLHLQLPPGVNEATLVNSPDLMRQLPTPLFDQVIRAFVHSFHCVMYAAMAFHIAGFVCMCLYTNKRIPEAVVASPKKDDEENMVGA